MVPIYPLHPLIVDVFVVKSGIVFGSLVGLVVAAVVGAAVVEPLVEFAVIVVDVVVVGRLVERVVVADLRRFVVAVVDSRAVVDESMNRDQLYREFPLGLVEHY